MTAFALWLPFAVPGGSIVSLCDVHVNNGNK
jgi:hypothetical protein